MLTQEWIRYRAVNRIIDSGSSRGLKGNFLELDDCCIICAADRMDKYSRVLKSAWINATPASEVVVPQRIEGKEGVIC